MSLRIYVAVASGDNDTIIIGPAGVHEEANRLGARYTRLWRFIFSRRGVSKTTTWEHLKIRYMLPRRAHPAHRRRPSLSTRRLWQHPTTAGGRERQPESPSNVVLHVYQ